MATPAYLGALAPAASGPPIQLTGPWASMSRCRRPPSMRPVTAPDFVVVVRSGHPLLANAEITAERYAAQGHVVASRHGLATGPVDEALAEQGLSRKIVAVVPSFRAALAVASASDLVALLTRSFFDGMAAGRVSRGLEVSSFPIPVRTAAITISQMWHPRLDTDPAHRWLRGLVSPTCRD